MPFVEVSKLWIKYKYFCAVKGISFEIPKGEIFGFIGPNGAGKTSTIKVMATLLSPSHGSVTISGHNTVNDPHKVRRSIGYMPDFFGVYEDLTVREYLEFFAAAFNISFKERKAVIGSVLELTDLTGKKDSSVESLSRGMKQRLSIARLLVHDPELLLLDEPASGLDPRARIEIRELFRELKNMGKTILISSHILSELASLCTMIGIIEAGQLIVQGTLDDIYNRIDIHRTIHVVIANLTDDILKKIAGIKGIINVEQQGERLSLKVKEDTMAPEDLLEEIHNLGARIHMYQPEALDIETAFMKLTEGKLA